jgi:low affinity Fe/Cu permease
MSFDLFAQRITNQVVRGWFFFAICLMILVWIPTLFLWETGPSDLLVDSITNPLSLLLLVLLQNSQSRQERAQDSRQDQLERALALLLHESAEHQRDQTQRRELQEAAEALVRNAGASSRMTKAE